MKPGKASEITAFSVVVPAYRATMTISACIDALLAAGFEPGEITVVDDGSPDDTGAKARAAGVHVIANPSPTRPANARNTGAATTQGDILVFVDADVVVHPGLREKLAQQFEDPALTAIIGSYDDAPAAPSVVSRYRNILHHATHQEAAGNVKTFWSGLGAVRRAAFDGAGGFDPAWEDIEDVELGLRITANGGQIRLDPSLQGTHLKDWTVQGMFRTDLFGRAVPWTRLLRSGRMPYGTLNTSTSHTVAAACVAVAGISLFAAVSWPAALWVFLASVLVFIGANWELLKRLAHSGGVLFALCALPYHAVHYIAGILGFAKVVIFERSQKRPR